MRITIGKKLITGFICVLLLLVSVGGISIWKINKMASHAKEINDDWIPSVQTLSQIQQDFIDIQRLSLLIALETDRNEMDQLVQKLNAEVDDLKKKQQTYESFIRSEEERTMYNIFAASEKKYLEFTPAIIEAAKEHNLVKVNVLVRENRDNFNRALRDLTDNIDLNKKGSTTAALASLQEAQSGSTLVTLLVVLAILMGIGIALMITRMISKPLVQMYGAVEKIAIGDLTADELQVKNRDEIGDLARSFNQMAKNLRTLIHQVMSSAEQVAASAEELTASAEQTVQATEQIATIAQEISIGSQKQSQSVKETSHTINEMAASVQQIAASSQSVSTTAVQTSDAAKEGNQSIQKAVQQMNFIHTTVNEAAQSIKQLGEHAKHIDTIVEIISNISNQTNLLALNAAIEAARAGEQGRGFAVVADEVRKLAEESRQSAQKIAEYIATIQDEIHKVVQKMEAGTIEVNTGIEVVHEAGNSFEQIQRLIHEVADQFQEVSSSVQQMAASSEQVVRTIDDVTEIAASSAAGTQTVSASAEEQLATMEEITASATALAKMAEELQTLVGQFKV
ncbi:methyl-accepting chemotaxis protein [Collibacillus ludicampi]|nr:methyl-accepting chemotaxis protein [Collibacillus ludicampi]